MTKRPLNIRLAVGIYAALLALPTVAFLMLSSSSSLRGRAYFSLMAASVPILGIAGLLLWKIWGGRNWARLTLTLFLLADFLAYALRTQHPVPPFGGLPSPVPTTSQQLGALVSSLAQLAVVMLLFSSTSNLWFTNRTIAYVQERQKALPKEALARRTEPSEAASRPLLSNLAVVTFNFAFGFVAIYLLIGISRIPLFKMLVLSNKGLSFWILEVALLAFVVLFGVSIYKSEHARAFNIFSSTTTFWALSPAFGLAAIVLTAGSLAGPCSLYQFGCNTPTTVASANPERPPPSQLEPLPVNEPAGFAREADRGAVPVNIPPESLLFTPPPNNVNSGANAESRRDETVRQPAVPDALPAPPSNNVPPHDALVLGRTSAPMATAPLAPTKSGGTEIYRCTDSSGHSIYSGTPCGTDAKVVEVHVSPPSVQHPASPTAFAATRSGNDSTRDQFIQDCQNKDFAQWRGKLTTLPDPVVINAVQSAIATKCRAMAGLR